MVQEYLNRRGLEKNQLWMAVLIQEMITPLYSGVVFNRNPITGARETVIEAVKRTWFSTRAGWHNTRSMGIPSR